MSARERADLRETAAAAAAVEPLLSAIACDYYDGKPEICRITLCNADSAANLVIFQLTTDQTGSRATFGEL